MGRTAHFAAALLLAAVCGACTKPSPTTAPLDPTPARSPSVTSAPSPTAVAAAPTPPYTIHSGRPEQEPGTIIFGDKEGNSIAPFAGYPLSFTIDRAWAFGAYFGRSVGASSVDVELFRQDGESWTSEWLDVADVAPEATGLLRSLPTFKDPGTYRLDIRVGGQVIATSLLSMVPPCVGVCTGG